MRILFDKGTPMPLRHRLFGHEVETSDQRGWDTLANGALTDRAEEAGFEVLLTTDQSIRPGESRAFPLKGVLPDTEGRAERRLPELPDRGKLDFPSLSRQPPGPEKPGVTLVSLRSPASKWDNGPSGARERPTAPARSRRNPARGPARSHWKERGSRRRKSGN